MCLQVLNRSLQEYHGVFHDTKQSIAPLAEQGTYLISSVIVIHGQAKHFPSQFLGFWFTTAGTHVVLGSSHCIVFFWG